jgi:hypothetical protein
MYYSPRIVTSGLVLALDAAERLSYPRTGTTWRDLSGNNNTGTLTNGPTFSAANMGSIVFDGTNDYTDFSDFSLGNQFTFCCWIKTSSTSFSQLIARGNTGDTAGVYLAINLSTGLLAAGGNNGSGWNSNSISTITINDNRWHYVVGVYNQTSNNCTGYVDGILGSSISLTFDSNSYTPKNTKIGKNQIGSSQYYNGNIALSQIYNRALTAAEVLQNYNAVKSRFGL